jgi:hypothetical protein
VKEPFPEFNALIMAMSTGPVAFSDKIGYSNSSLILRTCREDGVLLQPIQPLIPIHDWFFLNAHDGPFHGHIQESKMKVNGLPPYSIVVALELEEDFSLKPSHLYDFCDHDLPSVVYDSSLSSILQNFDENACPLVLERSRSTTPEDYQIFFIAPVIDGWCLLGEMNKFVPLSQNRFINVDIKPQEMSIMLEGSKGEIVDLAYSMLSDDSHQWIVRTQQVMIPASGQVKVVFNKPAEVTSPFANQSKLEVQRH